MINRGDYIKLRKHCNVAMKSYGLNIESLFEDGFDHVHKVIDVQADFFVVMGPGHRLYFSNDWCYKVDYNPYKKTCPECKGTGYVILLEPHSCSLCGNGEKLTSEEFSDLTRIKR